MERATQAWAETSNGGVVLSISGMSLMMSALQCKYSTGKTKHVIMFQCSVHLIKGITKHVKAGVNVKAVLRSLNTAFLPISRSRFKRH